MFYGSVLHSHFYGLNQYFKMDNCRFMPQFGHHMKECVLFISATRICICNEGA